MPTGSQMTHLFTLEHRGNARVPNATTCLWCVYCTWKYVLTFDFQEAVIAPRL